MLWGRGAVDMKNMDAMMLTSLGDILRAGERPARDLVVGFFADEEAGGVLGSHFLVKEHPELFEGATEAISEVGGYSIDHRRAPRLPRCRRARRPSSGSRCVARGTAGHGSQMIRGERRHPTRARRSPRSAGRSGPSHLTDTTTALLGEVARILDVDVDADRRRTSSCCTRARRRASSAAPSARRRTRRC